MALPNRAYNPLSYLEAGSGNVPVLLVCGNFAGKLWWRELLDILSPARVSSPSASPASARAPAGMPSHPASPPTPAPVSWTL